MKKNNEKNRCCWATNPLLIEYHDNEYGRIKTDDNSIFAKFCMEVFAQGVYYTEVLELKDSIETGSIALTKKNAHVWRTSGWTSLRKRLARIKTSFTRCGITRAAAWI
jgi:hypothetical protein